MEARVPLLRKGGWVNTGRKLFYQVRCGSWNTRRRRWPSFPLEIFMGTCQRCGRCYSGQGPLEALMMKGYRFDNMEKDTWVYQSEPYLDKERAVKDIDLELD